MSGEVSESLVGHWRGDLAEMPAGYLYAGYATLDLTIEAGGRWTATRTDRGRTERLSGLVEERRGLIVLRGAPEPGHPSDSLVEYRLKRKGDTLWGMTQTLFSGRSASALVELHKAT